MKFDAYTKIVLTIIATCLIWLCVKDVSISLPVHAASQPQVLQVTKYSLAWNANSNKGQVVLKYSNDKFEKIQVTSAADLAGWAAVLNQNPVNRNNLGWLYTGGEVPGE